jgi:hypothetical protein
MYCNSTKVDNKSSNEPEFPLSAELEKYLVYRQKGKFKLPYVNVNAKKVQTSYKSKSKGTLHMHQFEIIHLDGNMKSIISVY